jgi:ribose transport system ATP-binding protein
VLFLDEPTEPFQQADIVQLSNHQSACARKVAIVYVSHRLREIEQIADHITVLRDGKVIDSRPAAQKLPPTRSSP